MSRTHRTRRTSARALTLAAFTLLAAAPSAHAAPAEVPCSWSGGHLWCDFWVPGDGFSAGAPVVVASHGIGHEQVGALPQGRNWIVCQLQGSTISQNGYSNNWWAWTTAENGRTGWVNALWASGGDNYGGFANAPLCGDDKPAVP